MSNPKDQQTPDTADEGRPAAGENPLDHIGDEAPDHDPFTDYDQPVQPGTDPEGQAQP